MSNSGCTAQSFDDGCPKYQLLEPDQLALGASDRPLGFLYPGLSFLRYQEVYSHQLLQVSKRDVSSGMEVSIASKESLDVNITATFVELAVTTLSVWAREGEKVLQRARGGDAPYRIRNLTGDIIQVWSDNEKESKSPHSQAMELANGDSTDWRFDDWKTMREVRGRGSFFILSDAHHCL